MNPTPEHRFLGLAGVPDDRQLLSLPAEGALKSGQVEAALERRIDEIARHPLAGSVEARRLISHLEAAADRLQATIALEGRGPLHPGAARRAAHRVALATKAAESATAVVVPKALRRVGSGLSAEDLTEFDRLALAVLVVSGGWNATSAKRLSIIAEDHGVSVADLNRVVLGLTRFLSEGEGLRGAMGEVGAEARTTFLATSRISRTAATEGAVERVFERIDSVLRDELRSDSTGSQVRITIVFAVFALSWIGVLAWVFFGSKPDTAPTDGTQPATSLAADDASSAPEPVDAPRGANGEAIAPVAVLAAPVKYPRPPGFVPSPTPRAIVESASAGAAWVADVDEVARDARSAGGRPSADALRKLAKTLSLASDAWPASGAYRGEVLRAFANAAREVRDADALRSMMQAVPGGPPDAALVNLPAWQRGWRNAFGAGALAVIALDPSQAPEVAAAAREEMRLRSQPIPRGPVRDPFAAGAIAALSADALPLAEALALGTADLEHASRWSEAVDAASSSSDLRNRAALAAIDASLRAPGAIDKPGPLVDFLAYAIHILDFTGRGEEPEAIRNSLSSWMLDENIPPARIWALTSVLDADLGIAWYGPDLVLATNATRGDRAQLVERMLKAFPQVTETTVGEAIIVDKIPLEDWQKSIASAAGLAATDTADHLRRAAVALAAMRTARAFERGDLKAAKAAGEAMNELLRREDKEWIASPTGERAGLPAAGVGDGQFADELQAAGRDVARRVSLIRALGARPAAGDLGPIDARAAALEALRSNLGESRSAMATVLADRYANGTTVLRAVLDLIVEGSVAVDAPEFVSRLVGTRVAGADWRSEARERIIARIFILEDSRAHAVDESGSDIAAVASDLAASYDPSAAAGATRRPDRALALLADAMRDAAQQRFLAEPFPASIEEIERQRAARRSLAEGVMQRMSAETPAIAQYAAMLVAARQPALQSKLGEHLLAARRARSGASSAAEQVEIDLNAVLRILNEGFAPEATRRDDA
ncbi:MAG: hypothetical protein RLY21_300 [Planctomycetota bacterium]|jgi:hypothetical protein